MRVFVAGATGAIGKQLVPRLVAAGHEVHGMTRSESKQAMLDELGAVPVVADALDPDQVAQAIVLRYGALCGPGTSMAPGEEQFELVREGKFPLVGGGGRGVYNVVDDDPAPVAEWLPALARMLGTQQPMQAPRLAAGEAGAVLMTELRGASNARAKRELGWQPGHPSWRQGFAP